MKEMDYILSVKERMPQLCHAANILKKFESRNLKEREKTGLTRIAKAYFNYLREMISIDTFGEAAVRRKAALLNEYYDFIHTNGYDNLFSSQGKFRPTILEEFVYLLFKDFISACKDRFDAKDRLSSGSVKAYTNLFFKPTNLESFINEAEIAVNEKDQDYAIFRSFDIAIDDSTNKLKVRVPAVAIEVKTYIDKTMLDSIIATAEKVKSGNPYTFFVSVAEWYDVSTAVDPSYSRIDQIYILRKGRRKETPWTPISQDVVVRLFNETVAHLERTWSDVEHRLETEGVIL